ncbi:class II aldolase/adducin family protein [Leucobacter sp. CSA1]|uniref:Class II aldolase/adducin family protein n=1 Tax=Leucobacter chromiisoli TaxID=2796471 RepID=A0A934Q935_9MICO|nr:class II aldolase/adducin family protein [Leucobacter chromiisoli]MBK0418899.1 class II aldolase/adducin family protein [Leucobacter chromiisoli]
MPAADRDRLIRAANIVADAGLSDAFGHLSIRVASEELEITPPLPLRSLTAATGLVALPLTGDELPDGAPREAWIHRAIASARPEAGAIVRAQPPAVAAMAASGLPLRPLHGHGAFLGDPVPVHDDSRLIRDAESAEAVARTLGSGSAIVLRGNGAVTVAETPEQAVALMWVLERSAEINLRAHSVGNAPIVLSAEEQAWWADRAAELLPRIYRYLEGARAA